MVLWSDRHIMYKVSLCNLVLATMTYIMGFALPYWSVVELEFLQQSNGLWQACVSPPLMCAPVDDGVNTSWLLIVRVMLTLSLVLVLTALSLAIVNNSHDCQSRVCVTLVKAVECLAGVASTLGMLGCILYAAKFKHMYDNTQQTPAPASPRLHTAFFIVCGAQGLVGLCACIMFAFNQPRRRRGSGTGHRRRRRSRPPHLASYLGPAAAESAGREEVFSIPYYGEITENQLVYGAGPVQPPSYDSITARGVNGTEPPPKYEEVTKDQGLPPF